MMVEIEGLGITYRGGAEPALEEINLGVRRGEFLLLTGHTGCGKTTLIRALAGLLAPEHVARWRGSASVAGFDCRRVNHEPAAPRVGVLFQNPDDQIVGGTPREEVAFGLENYSCPREEMSGRIERALAEVGIGALAEAPVASLSGGQKQRTAIAAVLALEPDMILLDEPTSNLDGHGRRQLCEVLDRLRSEGRTVIIAAHDVRRLGPLCDRVALLEGGRLVKAGPVATTLREVVEKLGGTAVEDGEDSVTTVGPDSTSADGGGPVVEVEALRFAYPTNGFNLGPLSFAIEAGERVALLGPNGGGKTTLLSLLAGQLSPQKGGNLRVCGIDPRSRARRRLPALVSLVTQNPDLMLHSPTVEREIAARPRYLRLPVGRHQQEVTGILAGFDLERLAQKHPFSLSQGQRQRLAMAAAISGGARLLMVDEPTTGQDMRQRGALLRRIRRLADAGLAVLFSTHSLEAALAAAGRAMVIEKGKLIFDGPITALRRNQQLLDLAGLDLPPAVGGGPGSS